MISHLGVSCILKTQLSRGLDLINTEEPSRHRAGEAGSYLVAIRLKPIQLDDYSLINSSVYITHGANNLTTYPLRKLTVANILIYLRSGATILGGCYRSGHTVILGATVAASRVDLFLHDSFLSTDFVAIF
jgi:hypothetical protein